MGLQKVRRAKHTCGMNQTFLNLRRQRSFFKKMHGFRFSDLGLRYSETLKNILLDFYIHVLHPSMFVNNCSFSSKPISTGVPQGSILGPLLFLICMNDLYNATLSRPRLFADDTCL